MPDAEDSSSGDGSSDSDSEEEVELEPQQLEKLMKIEGELETAPDYSKMIEYIGLLRHAKLRARLRSAYERMASLFPMNEQLWLDWVNDELEQVHSEEDIERIQHIFQQATQDYLSTNIWSQYLGFVAELDPAVRGRTPAGVGKMRELCEAALTAAGLHATEGGKLWSQYREFELGLLESGGQGLEKQAEKVRSIFQRQLQVPLADHKETMEAYKAWEAQQGKSVPPHVVKAAEKAAEAFTLRLPYEQAVSADRPADAALLAAYLSYIKLEQAQKDPARVQVVYERAVTCFPVTAELWAQYTKYLEYNLKVPSVVNAVYARATRNCYWVGSLWAAALRALDRFGAPKQELDAKCKAALSSGMQTVEDYMDVLLAHLDALRHRTACPSSPSADGASSMNSSAAGAVAPEELRAAFGEASATLAAYWPTYQDRLLRLPSYQAHCELHVLKDHAAARKVWEDTLKSGLGRYYETWLAYANMERGLRNLREARNVFKRAYSRRLEEGGQPLVCAEWLHFEREEGSAEDLHHASIKVDPVMEEAAAAAAAAADQQAAAAAKAAAKQAPKLSKEEIRQMRQQNDPNFGKSGKAVAGKGAAAKQAKAAAKGKGESGKAVAEPAGGTAKRGRAEEAGSNGAEAVNVDEHEEGNAKRARLTEPAAADNAQQQQQQQQQQEKAEQDHEMADAEDAGQSNQQHTEGGDAEMDGEQLPTTTQHESVREKFSEEYTVFVRGLPLDTKESDLEQFFKSCGTLKRLRMPKNHETGAFRGIAYVEFEDQQGLQQAVALNGSTLPGSSSQQPLFIAKSSPPGKGPAGGRGSRGRGGRGFGGRGDGFAGGRGQGRFGGGGRSGGGERGGRFGGGGRGEGAPSGRGAPAAHQRHKMQVADAPVSTAPFMPRAVASKVAGHPEGSTQPKSNDDFRKMLLSGKK